LVLVDSDSCVGNHTGTLEKILLAAYIVNDTVQNSANLRLFEEFK
jgi:hypothetical protein